MFEPSEVARWERLTLAMIRNAAHDDPEAFAQVVAVLARASDLLPAAAQLLVASTDAAPDLPMSAFSWAGLARALGVSRQAAWKRFGRRNLCGWDSDGEFGCWMVVGHGGKHASISRGTD